MKWILDNVEGARSAAEQGDLLMGTIDSWLIWRLTNGQCHATDYTNASRTLLFNIHTLDWDDELLRLFTIPRSMMPKPMPSDAIYGETTIEGILPHPIAIAGILGDSHGALVGQMCFEPGMGKATYGTGSSVMVNIGEKAKPAPQGLVTSVGFAALGKVFYSFEGNIHCTGATINWLMNNLKMISSPAEIEEAALSVPDNGGVYIVPAFAGLGAPWWNNDVRAAIFGMTLGTERNHILRATLESIAYQINDLVGTMAGQAGIAVKEMRVDGGPTKNNFLMQYQTDCLRVPVDCSNIEEASALGAVIMNRTALGAMTNFEEIQAMRSSRKRYQPQDNAALMEQYIKGWHNAVSQLLK